MIAPAVPDAAQYLRPGVPSGTGCGCASRLLNHPPGTGRGGGGIEPGREWGEVGVEGWLCRDSESALQLKFMCCTCPVDPSPLLPIGTTGQRWRTGG